jgi:hypothetical protein
MFNVDKPCTILWQLCYNRAHFNDMVVEGEPHLAHLLSPPTSLSVA